MTPEQHRQAAEDHCREARLRCVWWLNGDPAERTRINLIISDLTATLNKLKDLKPKDASTGDGK